MCCVEDLNSYQLSCPGRSSPRIESCCGLNLTVAQHFFFTKGTVLGVVDLFCFPFAVLPGCLSRALGQLFTAYSFIPHTQVYT